jgi:transcriptional regulator with XRE-family HTH domain
MSSEKTPVQVSRVTTQQAVKRMLAKARVDADIDQQEVADRVGVNRSIPGRWEQRDGDKHISLADAALMPEPIGRELARWLADQHGQTVAPAHVDADITLSTLAGVMTEVSDVTNALVSALADNHLSAAEYDQIEREANEAVEKLTRLANTARKSKQQMAPVRAVASR